ncbi:MAG: hypothetical protein ACK56F_27360, partial [bacterium]
PHQLIPSDKPQHYRTQPDNKTDKRSDFHFQPPKRTVVPENNPHFDLGGTEETGLVGQVEDCRRSGCFDQSLAY